MMDAAVSGRENQKRRTRRHLLDAAARLLAQGKTITLEDVAAEALVSRATVYRYFTSPEQLMSEAALDLAAPHPETLFAKDASTDPVARLEKADEALDAMVYANEMALRALVITALQRKLNGDQVQVRQNRRTPLIEAALAPARKEFKPAQLAMLRKAMALVLGTESMLAFKDVLGLDEAETRRVKRWMIRALVDAARK
jgi:AcrR family transcriptional regulator